MKQIKHSSLANRIGETRRGFIKKGVCLCGLPVIIKASALGLNGAIAANSRLNMGCIGVGGQGTRQMAGGIWSPEGGFIAQPSIRVVAVCDANKNNVGRAKGIVNQRYGNNDCAVYRDFRELLSRKDIDVVLIATGERWHPYISVYAAKQGKDIYCEKPVSLTVYEARVLADTVKQYGVIFQIGTQQRSMNNFRFACELVRNGYIGDVKYVAADVTGGASYCDLPGEPVPDWLDWDLWLGPSPWRPYNSKIVFGWMAYSDYSGGDMTNWGAHVFDIVQWGLGMDDSGPLEVIPPDGKNVKYLTYIYPGNVKVERKSIPGMSKGIMFVGSKGVVKVSREVFETQPESLMRQKIAPNEIHLHYSTNHHTDFLNSVRTRTRPASDAEIACRSITVAHIGNIAEKLGRPLKWDSKKERFINDEEANKLLARPMRAPWVL
ncbi:MAG: Gfo/Idh/MocA family protein [Verrucomicrobiia bacterium]